VVTSPTVQGSSVLNGVAIAPDGSIYAVGWSVLTGGKTVPLVERFAQNAWSVQHATGAGQLAAVAIQPDGTPLAVASRTADDRHHILPMEPSGQTWSTVADATGQAGRLQAIAVGESTVAVGFTLNDGIPHPLVARFEQGWTPIDVTGEMAPEP